MTPPDEMNFTQFRSLFWNRVANMEVPNFSSRFQKRVSELSCREIKVWVMFLRSLADEYLNSTIEDEADLEDVRNCLQYWEKIC